MVHFWTRKVSQVAPRLPEQGLWCRDDHTPAMRVSGIQFGSFSGPAGSTVGKQPYREGLTVGEEQEPFWGCPGPPSYQMQLMLAAFDFPERSSGVDAEAAPALIVDHLPATDAESRHRQ